MKWVDSVDRNLCQVRVADSVAGLPGPWRPFSDFVFPHGPFPGYPAVEASGGYQYTPGGAWFNPGYRYTPAAPDPVSTKPTLPCPAPAVARCECGSDSINGGGHSDWCPKYPGQGVG